MKSNSCKLGSLVDLVNVSTVLAHSVLPGQYNRSCPLHNDSAVLFEKNFIYFIFLNSLPYSSITSTSSSDAITPTVVRPETLLFSALKVTIEAVRFLVTIDQKCLSPSVELNKMRLLLSIN